MGFFSDLKEDLSQAVNELMPEEALEAAMAGSTEPEDTSPDELLTNEPLTKDETVDSVDLISMLDKLEDLDTANDALEEAVLPESMSEDLAALLEPEPAAEEEIVPEETVLAAEPEEEITPEPELITEPEEEIVPEPEEVVVPETEVTKEPEAEAVMEAELAGEPEAQSDNTIAGLSGEEEENMDAQTLTQEQTQTQAEEPINRVAVDETAVVTEGMTITGDIVSAGSMELIGTVNGNLDIYGKLNITGTIQGDSKAAEIYAEGAKITGEVHSQGSVKIGQSSVVIGNIAAASAVIAGAVKGDIDVQGPVILDTTAIVMGNIKSKSVQINNGAVIEGLCSQCYADVNPTSFFEEFKKRK
ncbi:MAG: polymer-forming cytoskeletal protein [Lachnospiraceae bacterium]|nr:polymer-forming cytoskeletal protein [Lachnospiraceae bacterium]